MFFKATPVFTETRGLGFGAEDFGFDVLEDLETGFGFGDLFLGTGFGFGDFFLGTGFGFGFGFEAFLAFEDADDFEGAETVDCKREGGRMFFALLGKHHSVNFELDT